MKTVLTTVLLLRVCAMATAGEPVRLVFDAAAPGKTITNKFGDINMWDVNETWTSKAAGQPEDYFRRQFPFVERIQLMAATGGNERRDLFKDPADRRTRTDYDFGRLIDACRNIVRMGLRPMVKTGWVPLKLSSEPKIGKAFDTNLRPVADYDAYYAYIKALAEAMKTHFGIEELRTWTWGVGVEYENKDWFEAQDGLPETTKLAYFRLYDTTVAALEDALGAENVIVGAHSMSVSEGLWDERDFIEHCAAGEDLYRPGRKGAQLDYLAVSYYTLRPGFEADRFIRTVRTVRDRARQLGLTGLKYGVDEGRVLTGHDRREVYNREVQHPVQVAGDAQLFHVMVEQDVDYFSTWCITTEGLFGGIPIASANLRNLVYRMVGSRMLASDRSGEAASPDNEISGLAGYDAASRTLRVLVYNFSRARDAEGDEPVDVRIRHVRPIGGQAVTARAWVLDEDHGNWWKLWKADMDERKLTADSFVRSMWTIYLPGELTKVEDRAFWRSRVGEYEKRGRMVPASQPV